MPIDPDIAIGATLPVHEFRWTSSEVLLYNLALGAGRPPADPNELRYTYERDLRALPTFPIVAPTFNQATPPVVSFPGIEIDLAAVLHGSQEIVLHRPIPVEGTARAQTRIADVHDKGKAAVITQETSTTDPDGTPLCTTRSSIFARGEGGFGGQRGSSERLEYPDREPDAVLETPTLHQQALLYRLCGDRNPLHVDPSFAASAGFPAPILHGLCTYGMVCKALIDGVIDGDVDRLISYAARFAGVVYPGETIRTNVWHVSADRLVATASAMERDDAPVLADIVVGLSGATS